MRKFEFDRQKFKNLVHYIIWKCPDPAKLGSLKLHKILWKSDGKHYMLHGQPITGARYTKREWGPCADALLPIRDELAKEGAIKFWRDRKFAGDYKKDVYEVLRPPPSNFLTAEEQQIVDFWINEICLKRTAASISEETHGYAWEIARMGEELPIYAALAERGREPTKEELDWARERAKRRGLI